MHRTVKALACVAIGAFGASGAAAFELALEAELANEIVAPMVIGVPGDGADAGGPGVNEPSNGAWVWAPGPPVQGDAIAHQGHMTFVIDIPKETTYYIWGNVIAWDGNSDSFWVTVTPVDEDPNPQASQDTTFRWGVQQGPGWHWDQINQWLTLARLSGSGRFPPAKQKSPFGLVRRRRCSTRSGSLTTTELAAASCQPTRIVTRRSKAARRRWTRPARPQRRGRD